MSLLMKALEKAAKDRLDTKSEQPVSKATESQAAGAATTAEKSELTLEPLSAQASAPPATAAATPAPARAQAPLPRARAPAAAAAAPAPDPAAAATVIRASRDVARGGILTYLRERRLVVLGALTTLFLIGYGGYVYTEMNPGVFTRQAPRPASGAPIVQARTPAPPTAPATPPPAPLVSLLPPVPLAAGTEPRPPQTPVASPSARKSTGAIPAQAPVSPAPAPAPISPRDTIRVTSGNTPPTVTPLLAEAYGALTAGKLESAQQLYGQLLNNDSGNVEALLGLASIATQQGNSGAATSHYVKILELDPRNTLAQAGLIGVIGRADPASAETRVKQLIARDPSAAYLHFTLGNTYVDQNRWPDAQQSYFQAHHLQPDNPDYAYNLAVALEHIGQARPALDYYRRAVQLAASKGRANFSPAVAQERVSKLEKIVQ